MKTPRFIRSPFPAALLLVAALLLGSGWSPLGAQSIPPGDLVLDLQPFATLPNSGNDQPARASVLTSTPDGRIFVNDQRGLLYTVSADGTIVTLYLDLAALTPLLSDNGERGFHGFAFHPEFNTPGTRGYGKFYTLASQRDTDVPATFTPGVPGAGHTHDEVLLEWSALDPSAGVFRPADAARPFREVLRIARPNPNHNAGYLAFNPTAAPDGADWGNLYFGVGDSGGAGDPLGLAQSLGNAYGALLRIDPLLPAADDPRRSANGQYRVPADNPSFTTNPALLPEKFAAGLRNPQRFTWDLTDGRLFIADIGQNQVEEIDLGRAGANYGWNRREGSFVYHADGSIGASVRDDAATTGFTYPVAEYRHFGSAGNGVTAGPVLRGERFPGLGDGSRLLFADFPTGVAYTVDADNLPQGGQDGITELRLRQDGVERRFLDFIRQVNPAAGRADLRFGTDAAGNVYFLNKQDGVIRRVVTTPTPPADAPVTLKLSTDATTIRRRAGQVATVTLRRAEAGNTPLEVSYTLTGTLVGGTDYATLSGVLEIPAGQTSGSVQIVPLDGGANGKVKLTVTPGPGYRVGKPNQVKVKITK